MKAKSVNEDVKNTFKAKDESEYSEHIKPGENVPAEILARLINKSEIGYSVKVNFDGAWDKFGPVVKVLTVEINQGFGFEKALLLYCNRGTFLYTPPYKLDMLPTDDTMLLFYAGKNSIYFNSIIDLKND